MRKSEVREMPSLPRGGGDELVRDEQVSSRRVRPRSLPVGGPGGTSRCLFRRATPVPGLKAWLPLRVERKRLTVCTCARVRVFSLHRNS